MSNRKLKSLGQIAYEYCLPPYMPSWEALGPETNRIWQGMSRAVIREHAKREKAKLNPQKPALNPFHVKRKK